MSGPFRPAQVSQPASRLTPLAALQHVSKSRHVSTAFPFDMLAGTCNGDTACRDDFFSDPMAAQYYRDHVKTVLTRVNSINGRLYRCVCMLGKPTLLAGNEYQQL